MVDSVGNSTSTAASTTKSAVDRTQLADNFDAFLKLLTTQLQYQDPLEPMDTQQFTQQLVQFASVEQNISTNTNLEKLISLQSGQTNALMLGYVGKTVDVETDQVNLKNGAATIDYSLGVNTDEMNISIFNQDGDLVRTINGDTNAGIHQIAWDGTDDQGLPLDDGTYSIKLSAIDPTNGETVSLPATIKARVTGVETDPTTGQQLLYLDNSSLIVPLSQVTAVHESVAEANGS